MRDVDLLLHVGCPRRASIILPSLLLLRLLKLPLLSDLPSHENLAPAYTCIQVGGATAKDFVTIACVSACYVAKGPLRIYKWQSAINTSMHMR